ncbi:TonB-dependent receptor [Qipengyuania sp. RS5-5]|uniref:TonB-dependent receptor n=2 Tax=Parerythrobacter lacustris TaxID=2969984 RepID=A0ABT1XTR4_9SPHN|nr:TonB-dependent receptor [Parerythrobacter lacustris]
MKPFHATASLMAIALTLPAIAFAQQGGGALGNPNADTAFAQPAEEPVDDPDADIVVIAERIRGQVDTDLPPVLELEEADIKAFGSNSIADLVAQLTPQVSSGSGRGSGRPVFLVNGQRVSSFREFSLYPPEAIRKVEVLPEEVALQFGFPATQRVINFILKDDFVSREIELEYGGPTAGGRVSPQVEVSMLTIDGRRRLQVSGEYQYESLLTEDERNIVQTDGSVPTVATDPDPAGFRSLAAQSDTYELQTTYNTVLGPNPGDGTVSLNGNLQRSNTRSLSGLDTVLLTGPNGATALRTLDSNALERNTETTTLSFGTSVGKPVGDWELTFTLDANRTWNDTLIDRRRDTQALVDAAAAGTLVIDGPLPTVADAGTDEAISRTWTADSLLTAQANPFVLPAGEASLTLKSGYKWNRIESDDTRSTAGAVELTRGRLESGFSAGLPLTSKDEGVLGAVGDITLNLSGGVDHLSDFGTLTNWSSGINWRLGERLSMTASYTEREEAPSLTQLGAPQVQTFNVPVFDLANNETVLATVTTGGNPNLAAEKQRDIKLGAYYDLDLFERANLQVEYFRIRSDNVTEGFPVLSPAVEAAFPDRITRDSNDRLIAIDRRPITFAERNSSRVRYGFNLSGRVGKPSAEGPGGGFGGGRPGGAPVAGATPAVGAPGTGPGDGRPAFDPAQFAQLRTEFCALEDPTTFDFSKLPEQMVARLRGEDGQIDMERVKQLRERFCSEEAGPGGPGGGFDSERIAAMRTAICTVPEDGSLPDLSMLPERFLERLRGADGQIDPARLAALREQLCNTPAPASQGGAQASAQGEGRRGGGEGRRGGGGGGRGGGGGPGGFGPGGGDGQGRWFLSLFHSVELENEALVAPGVPVFDLLDGDALGSGGVSRHTVQLEGGMFYRGFGLRLSGNYLSPSRINGSGLPGSTDLFFDDLATFDIRLFMDLEQQKWLYGEEPGFLKGARLSLRANNVFDAQRRVTDGTGTVPLSYQPGLIDPLGRRVEVEFRKVF